MFDSSRPMDADVSAAGVRIRADLETLVRRLLGLGEDTRVRVTQVRCPDPGCPDVDTVIAIFAPSGPGRRVLLRSPLGLVTKALLVAALQREGLLPASH